MSDVLEIQVAKMELKAGDVVVALVPADIGADHAGWLVEQLVAVVPSGVKAIVVPDWVELKIVEPEDPE